MNDKWDEIMENPNEAFRIMFAYTHKHLLEHFKGYLMNKGDYRYSG